MTGDASRHSEGTARVDVIAELLRVQRFHERQAHGVDMRGSKQLVRPGQMSYGVGSRYLVS